MASTGRGTTIRRWLARMSWPAAVADPQLAFVRAVVACLDDHYDDAVLHLDAARQGPTGLTDATGLPLALPGRLPRRPGRRGPGGPGARVGPACGRHRPVVGLGRGRCRGRRPGRVPPGPLGRRRLQPAPGREQDPRHPSPAPGRRGRRPGLAEADAPDGAARAGPMLEPMLARLAAIGAHRGTVAAVLHLARGETDRTSGNLRAAARSFSAATELLAGSPPGTWLALAHLLRSQTEHALGNAAAAILSVSAADDVLTRVAEPREPGGSARPTSPTSPRLRPGSPPSSGSSCPSASSPSSTSPRPGSSSGRSPTSSSSPTTR